MTVLHRIEKYFWVCLVLAILFGIFLPQLFINFQGSILYIIMTILFLVMLKVNIADMFHHIRKPIQLLYIVLFNIVAMPLILFVIFNGRIDPETLMGIVLLAALPCGVSSAAFTDMMEGHTSLTLTIILISTLLAPFTIPIVFWILYNATLELDYFSLFKNMVMLIMIPTVLSQIVKALFNEHVYRIQKSVNALVIFLLSFMIMTIISVYSEYLIEHAKSMLPIIGILYIVFFIMQTLGYFSVFWMKKGEKVAVANSNVIMNNMLGVVLAMAFFSPKVVLIIVLSIIPWNTMVILFHHIKRHLP